ncbi:hypothetical protein ZIOFF_017158 [Zingiber officinale]|uniref:Uncharacterized protein n=1 Tax=Zingiber officinale TaxID=94328 RepID=A0A8J5LI48_ZINOF|nr:hypothetical protein ZIOFF_017158 [Zingiber officinale]
MYVSDFEEAGRGAVALEDMSIGGIALEIPESLIISEDLVYNSDMFDVLKKLDDITPETMLLLWSMRERFNPNSKFKIYFDTLPTEFNTATSTGAARNTCRWRKEMSLINVKRKKISLEAVQVLYDLCPGRDGYPIACSLLLEKEGQGTPISLKRKSTKFHWRPAWAIRDSKGLNFRVDALAALEGTLLFEELLQSKELCPHILHYGRVDPVTKTLKFPVSRPCEKGNQCYLSYGSLPSSHFLMFYGFLPKGDNFYDVIPLGPVDHNNPLDAANGRNTHMVRGTWLSNADKPHAYGLPPKLLAHLHAVLKSDVRLDYFIMPSYAMQNPIVVLEL